MYVWKYKTTSSSAKEAEELSRQCNIPKLLALLFVNRNIKDARNVRIYLKKTLDAVHDPALFPEMDKATERIIRAIENKEKITIYGDYDVDGVTSAALLTSFFRDRGVNADYYIPDRESEGYGINVMAVNKISKNGTKLLITVDCGITACGEVELAKTLGMDVIITDHHLCKEKIPSAAAVIDAKTPGCTYPFDALAGVGVAFKLALSAAKALGEKTSDCFFSYVELAAVGTIADVVPLQDENRVIAEKGLKSLAAPKNIGLSALIKSSGAGEREINATSVAFMLAPRINAGGRLGSAATGVELLLCKDAEKAAELADELETANRDRRLFEQKIYEEALEMIAADAEFDKKKVIVLAKKGWHHGVIGIVASRITEKFYRPSIIIAIDEKGRGKGSGRSIEGFHLFNALSGCSDVLTNFGGHSAAAGVGLDENDIEAFSKKINAVAAKMMTEDMLVPKLDIDFELPPAMATLENAAMLEYMEPFGAENPKPVFSISNARVKKISKIGSDSMHLRLEIEKDGKALNAVGFRMADFADTKPAGSEISVAFTLEINNFRGNKNVQLILKDIK